VYEMCYINKLALPFWNLFLHKAITGCSRETEWDHITA